MMSTFAGRFIILRIPWAIYLRDVDAGAVLAAFGAFQP